MDYSSLVAPVSKPRTRANTTSQCTCSVCFVGRLRGSEYVKYKESMSEPVGRPRLYPFPAESQPMTVCNLCLSAWGPGKNHQCTITNKRENMEELVRSTNSNTRERILSSQLKEVSMEQGASTSGSIVKLTTGGVPIVARLGNTNQKPPPTFSNEVLNRLQLKTGLSDNKMRVVDNFLRVKGGRSSVVCHRKFMVDRNNKHKDLFEHKKMTLQEYVTNENKDRKERKKKVMNDVEKHVAYAKDVEDLARIVMEDRKI